MKKTKEQNPKKQINYKDALEDGLLDSYTKSRENDMLDHYETGLEKGDIKPTEEDIETMFPFSFSHYKTLHKKYKTKTHYYIYKQYHYKIEKEQKIIELQNQIEGLKMGRAEYKEKYDALKKKCEE